MRHDAMNKYKRLLSNTVILAVGTFSSKVLVYLLLPLYTAILSPAEYSDANIISQLANLLMPIAAVGVCDGLFRFGRRLIRNRFCDRLFRFGRGRLIRNRLCYVLFLSLRRSYGSFGLPHGYAAAGRT